jgi:3-hydroxybutyryl-CoA dehydrogenase
LTGSPLPIVGVVGAGTMGAGIAQLALEGGHEVRLHDVDPTAFERAAERIADGLARRVSKRGLADDAAAEAVRMMLERLRPVGDPEALASEAAVIIEAAAERLDLKRALFARLDAAAPATTLLATNTSALSVAAIASAAARYPERVIGLHFFNPAPVMRLVEVVSPPGADPAAVERGAGLVAGWGRMPIQCSDAPGFIVNRVNRPFTLEALRIVESGGSHVAAVDAALREDGFPMGPFELMDLVGLDVNLAAARAIHEAFGGSGEPEAERFRPSPLQERLVDAGRLGRKTGLGFYRYMEGRRVGPGPGFAPAGTAARSAVALAPEVIVERIRSAVAAEAKRALDDGLADADEIDLALVLGAGHPAGPFAWLRERASGASRAAGPAGLRPTGPTKRPAPQPTIRP